MKTTFSRKTLRNILLYLLCSCCTDRSVPNSKILEVWNILGVYSKKNIETIFLQKKSAWDFGVFSTKTWYPYLLTVVRKFPDNLEKFAGMQKYFRKTI